MRSGLARLSTRRDVLLTHYFYLVSIVFFLVMVLHVNKKREMATPTEHKGRRCHLARLSLQITYLRSLTNLFFRHTVLFSSFFGKYHYHILIFHLSVCSCTNHYKIPNIKYLILTETYHGLSLFYHSVLTGIYKKREMYL